MNKAHLVNGVAERAEVASRDAEAVVANRLAGNQESLVNGEVVKLSGFGNFEKKVRAARTGTNPADRSKIEIPERQTIVFKPSKTLKEDLNK